MKVIKYNFLLFRFFRFFLIFVLIVGWIFSGWPQLLEFRIQNIEYRVPPKIQETQAAWSVPKIGTLVTVASGDVALVEPAGIAQGDLMVACIGYRSNAAFTLPTGWSLVATQQSLGDVDASNGIASGVMAYIVRGASAPALTFTRTLGDVAQGRIIAYSGSTATPYDTGSANTLAAAAFDVTTASITTAEAGELIVAMTSIGDNDTTSLFDAATDPTTASGATDTTTAPTAGSWIERSDTVTITGADHGLAIADAIRATAGITGIMQATVIDDSRNVMIAGAFKMAIAPTVTTQAANPVGDTTATCNGTITATGGVNATAVGCEWDTDSGAPYANNPSTAGDYGAAPFTQSLTSIPSGTTIYTRAFATNIAGTGYGSEVSFLTKPAAPTGVSATDGTYTDKVTITWTKSTGATDYHVWRDAVDLGAAGDVATFDDTGADAPTITPGSAVASDGTSADYVALSLSGASANNGTAHTYKVVASNATGNSADSSTDTGYRGVGTLTYQWQRSAADSDADYLTISGATTASYNDTGAPADGSGRYYKCVLNATGAAQQTSTADRGYSLSTAISIRNVADSADVATITFPPGDSSAVISNPTGNVDLQVLTATASEASPVAILKSAAAYTLWYNVTSTSAWGDAVASEKLYVIAINGTLDLTDFGANAYNMTTWGTDQITTQSLAAGVNKELYLQVTLSALAGKSGTSTLSVLGEAL